MTLRTKRPPLGVVGSHRNGVPPVPIPNTEVKPVFVEGTAVFSVGE